MRRVDARDELELVRSAFEQLSEKQLRLLIGRVIWKEGAKTIAAAESPPVTPGEVYVSVHAALRKLRHAMNEAKGNPITPTVRRKRPARKTNANPDLLTTSEIDICELIEAGATHKKAAIQLGIPIGAVRYRMLAARRRIGAHSTLELIDHFRKQRAIEQSLSSQEG